MKYQKIKTKRFITVMFVDICNSTGLFANYDDEDVACLLENFISETKSAVSFYGGLINQTMGDGIYAIFGQSDHDYELQGISACLAAEKIQKISMEAITVRIGIHSGYVSVTDSKVFDGLNLHIVGKTVNIASHICSKATAGKTLLSEDTYELVKHYTLCAQQATFGKNNGYKKQLYKLNMNLSQANKFAYYRDFLSKEKAMIGRDIEFERLLINANLACSACSRHTHLAGEAGIGKTRMIYSLLDRLSQKFSELKILSYQPISYSSSKNVLDLLILETMSSMGLCSADTDSIKNVLAALQLNSPTFLTALLTIHGHKEESDKWKTLGNDEKTNIKTELAACLVVKLSEYKPVVIVFDDVHRCVMEDRIFFEVLQNKIGQGKFLLLTSSKKPEFNQTITTENTVNLFPLSSEEIKGLIRNHSLNRQISEEIESQIVRNANGNPYFATQFLKHVQASTKEDSGQVENVFLESLDAIFAFQVTGLEPSVAEILACAALLGKQFKFSDLKEVLNLDHNVLLEALKMLCMSDLIRVYGPISSQYEFTHEIAQKSICRSLTRQKSYLLHIKILEALRFKKIAKGDRLYAMAHHAFCAELFQKSYVYAWLAGTMALKQSLAVPAEKSLNLALESLKRIAPFSKQKAREISTLFKLAKSYSLSARPKEAYQIMQALMQEDLRIRGMIIPETSFREVWASIKWITSNFNREDIISFERGADVKHPMGMSTVLRCAGMLSDRGHFDESNDRLTRILRDFNFDNSTSNYGLLFPARSSCLSLMSKNFAELGNFFLANEYADTALEEVDNWGYSHRKVFVLVFASYSKILQKKFDQALPILEEAYALTKKFRMELIAPLVNSTYAYVSYFHSKDIKNIDIIKIVLSDMEQRGIFLRKAQYHLFLGEIFQDLNQWAEAKNQYEETYNLSKIYDEPHMQIKSSLSLIDLLMGGATEVSINSSPLFLEAKSCAIENSLVSLFERAEKKLFKEQVITIN